MALASGHWVEKESRGHAPSPSVLYVDTSEDYWESTFCTVQSHLCCGWSAGVYVRRTRGGGGVLPGPPLNEIHKLSISKLKWKLYIFGGQNEEEDFNDLKVMKLINPSERQPVMKEILSEFGLQVVSHSLAPTKVPNIKYQLRPPPPSPPATRVNPATQVFLRPNMSLPVLET
ncbi:hypothetical protein NHX12_027232 [Muraenolepis orangiensis]|uniref:Uncharacterized protein n=1 Tax=Muraenolepis orangiensis TaxID=630683 RepID=A0A9Q0EBZ5_9TELE|nr:hypothetical protein NHX12_027232 [Muraenolepis orangiensis]